MEKQLWYTHIEFQAQKKRRIDGKFSLFHNDSNWHQWEDENGMSEDDDENI